MEPTNLSFTRSCNYYIKGHIVRNIYINATIRTYLPLIIIPFGSHWPYGPHSMMGTYDELEIYNVDISKLY